MSKIGKRERESQDRVVQLFRDELGYTDLGNWHHRENNSNIEEDLLTAFLVESGYSHQQIRAALHQLRTEADNPNRSLYDNNKIVYEQLRYGIQVKVEIGAQHETVWLIDWTKPQRNHFAIAEEVSLRRGENRRPDLVLYVNGIAVAVLELKSDRVDVGDAIRQNISNQEDNPWFFSTVQYVFAGADHEGLRYGTVKTPAKYFLQWKEDEHDDSRYKLDKYLLKMCGKERFLDLMRDFVVFDAGSKKVPRVHQYFGVKAAQDHVQRRQGGIIWHTQGSGKSIVMVLLAKWILENIPDGRVAVITDRESLDRQIHDVFMDTGEKIQRATSGKDLIHKLGLPQARLICSLVHKFGRKGVDDFEAFLRDLETRASPAVGEMFIFVDECHRTQGGKLHRVMKALLPNAVMIGFTGTPLMIEDRQSIKVFGGYIHTYKFNEGVDDGVVLDLQYEARDIDQHLGSQDRIDRWFADKTRGLNAWQKGELMNQWGTMQKVLSSRSRMGRIVADIVYDFNIMPRLKSEHGNAILVARSIYEACKFFTLFNEGLGGLRDRCAVITSYNPQKKDTVLEDMGTHTDTDKQFIYNTYTELLKNVEFRPGKSRTEVYEDDAKKLFVEQPANMKLLIVVDKLLTGFNAPPCSVIYLDKKMQDHGLFQAICRVNRLDGPDKEFGMIVDYRDLFKKVENAISVYTSDLVPSTDDVQPEILLHERLKASRERLDLALEEVELLCEPVEPPRREDDYIRYFCGNTELEDDLKERKPQRTALYMAIVKLVRAYANLSGELGDAGYSPGEIDCIKSQVQHSIRLRALIRRAAGEILDLKPFEADMRLLIDTYIEADEPRKISAFDDMSLLEVIEKTGIRKAIEEQLADLQGNPEAIAETIENNVRSLIIKERLTNPAFYDHMSLLLREIIAERKTKAIAYEKYLIRVADLVRRVQAGVDDGNDRLKSASPAVRALYSNLQSTPPPSQTELVHEPQRTGYDGADPLLELAERIDQAVKDGRLDDWRGVPAKERAVKRTLLDVLGDETEVERIFPVVKAQREY